MRKNTLKLIFNSFLIFTGMIICSSCQKDNLSNSANIRQNEYIVSEDVACIIAENLIIPQEGEQLKLSSTNLKSSKSKKVKEIHSIPSEGKDNICYILNYEGGGFIILSADKRIMPILAFSDSSEFFLDEDNTPSGAVAWLYNVKESIEEVRIKNQIPDKKTEKEWENLISPKMIEPDPNDCEDEFEQVGPLLTTLWHQGCGFNSLLKTESEVGCTNLPCDRVYAGCVPIAMAQIMRFHQHPTTYNWSLMPNTYGSSETARLIKAIHDVLPVSYDCDGTGVDKDYNIANRLKSSFNYTYASQGSYNYETVKSNLRANKPVILSGGRDAGWWIFHDYDDGHMWVCDGFRRSKICMFDDYGNLIGAVSYLYLHMNWGWYNGLANGWYAFNNFNPVVNGTTYTFNYQTKMGYNIKP